MRNLRTCITLLVDVARCHTICMANGAQVLSGAGVGQGCGPFFSRGVCLIKYPMSTAREQRQTLLCPSHRRKQRKQGCHTNKQSACLLHVTLPFFRVSCFWHSTSMSSRAPFNGTFLILDSKPARPLSLMMRWTLQQAGQLMRIPIWRPVNFRTDRHPPHRPMEEASAQNRRKKCAA